MVTYPGSNNKLTINFRIRQPDKLFSESSKLSFRTWTLGYRLEASEVSFDSKGDFF